MAFWFLGKVTDEPQDWAESAAFALFALVLGDPGPRWRRYRRSRKLIRTRSAPPAISGVGHSVKTAANDISG